MMYVDDMLALFPRPVAPRMAVIVICLAVALGVPLSWKKLRLGPRVKWVGWDIRLVDSPSATLPEDKRARLLAGLHCLLVPGKKVLRRELESIVGLLSWFTTGARWLRPWLRQLFHLLHKPALTMRCLDGVQRREILDLCSAEGIVGRAAQLSDIPVGWRILQVGKHVWGEPEHVMQMYPDTERVWCKCADPTSLSVRITAEEAQVARFYHKLVEANVQVRLVEREGPSVLACADAFARGDRAGVGGWWFMPGLDGNKLDPSSIRWFSFSISADELPEWFCADGDRSRLQSFIAAFEALAQLVLCAGLLQAFPAERPRGVGDLVLRQFCDNDGAVGAVAKWSAMKRPLSDVVQSMALLCGRHKISLRVSHVAGHRNQWADALSRGPSVLPDFWHQLQAERRCFVDWQSLLELGRRV